MNKIYEFARKQPIRRTHDSWLGGVCAGIAHRFGVSPLVVRLITLALIPVAGIIIFAYALAWLFIPTYPENKIQAEEALNGSPGASTAGIIALSVLSFLIAIPVLSVLFGVLYYGPWPLNRLSFFEAFGPLIIFVLAVFGAVFIWRKLRNTDQKVNNSDFNNAKLGNNAGNTSPVNFSNGAGENSNPELVTTYVLGATPTAAGSAEAPLPAADQVFGAVSPTETFPASADPYQPYANNFQDQNYGAPYYNPQEYGSQQGYDLPSVYASAPTRPKSPAISGKYIAVTFALMFIALAAIILTGPLTLGKILLASGVLVSILGGAIAVAGIRGRRATWLTATGWLGFGIVPLLGFALVSPTPVLDAQVQQLNRISPNKDNTAVTVHSKNFNTKDLAAGETLTINSVFNDIDLTVPEGDAVIITATNIASIHINSLETWEVVNAEENNPLKNVSQEGLVDLITDDGYFELPHQDIFTNLPGGDPIVIKSPAAVNNEAKAKRININSTITELEIHNIDSSRSNVATAEAILEKLVKSGRVTSINDFLTDPSILDDDTYGSTEAERLRALNDSNIFTSVEQIPAEARELILKVIERELQDEINDTDDDRFDRD
ncbi:MAG: PspC domain-containing protein [Arcanobacterium sp.]|nr:PspC domain-containing protein [Arcanobacterium sp.]